MSEPRRCPATTAERSTLLSSRRASSTLQQVTSACFHRVHTIFPLSNGAWFVANGAETTKLCPRGRDASHVATLSVAARHAHEAARSVAKFNLQHSTPARCGLVLSDNRGRMRGRSARQVFEDVAGAGPLRKRCLWLFLQRRGPPGSDCEACNHLYPFRRAGTREVGATRGCSF